MAIDLASNNSNNNAITFLFETVSAVVDGISSFYLNSPRTLFAFVLILIYLVYYLRIVVQRPALFAQNGRFRTFLTENCPVINETYWPTVWCFETHLLTPIANFIRSLLPKLNYHKEFLPTPDGGQISLDWYDPDCDQHVCNGLGTCKSRVHLSHNKPIALFMPGLTGSSQAEYIKSIVPTVHAIGYRVVVMNYRGLGGTPLLTPRLYCAANDDDLRHALRHIRQNNPDARLVATGVSLGGIILGRYLVQSGASALVDAACLVSVCWDFMRGIESMERGLNYALNQHLTKALIRIIDRNEDIFRDVIDLTQVRSCKDLRTWDSEFTIRMFNFESVMHYYTTSSHKGKLNLIKRPCLALNAADDMFAPSEALPTEEAQESSHVAMLVPSRGGHIGFMEGLWPNKSGVFYSERVIAQYLQGLYQLDDLGQLDGRQSGP